MATETRSAKMPLPAAGSTASPAMSHRAAAKSRRRKGHGTPSGKEAFPARRQHRQSGDEPQGRREENGMPPPVDGEAGYTAGQHQAAEQRAEEQRLAEVEKPIEQQGEQRPRHGQYKAVLDEVGQG